MARRASARRRARRPRWPSSACDGAVHSLTRPASKRLAGPDARTTTKGDPLAPRDAWGHDHCWWLDRMVRTQAPLVERMTLVWHDWFATSKGGVAAEADAAPERAAAPARARATSRQLALDVTRDPAMLLWLNGTSNNRWDVNENYARELQELFCLGAGRGYSERDVRELARALTGFRNDWTDAGPARFRFDPQVPRRRASSGIYGKRGKFGWQDGVRLVVRHRRHPEFMVTQAVGVLHPDARRRRRPCKALARLYVRERPRGAPAARGDPRATRTSTTAARRMVKPPVVQAAGMLRAVGRGIDTDRLGVAVRERRPVPVHAAQRVRLGRHALAGHGDLPRAAGRWRSTSASPRALDPDKDAPNVPHDARRARLARPSAFWGVAGDVRRRARRAGALRAPTRWPPPTRTGRQTRDPVLALNALRMLVATSPDYLTADDRTAAPSTPARPRACPRSRPACPSRPAPGSRAARFLLRSARAGARRLRRRPARAGAVFEAGVAQAQAAGPPGTRAAERLHGRRASTRCRVLAPVGDPDYRRLRPTLAVRRRARRSPRTRACAWHPVGVRAGRPARRGQGLRAARRSATRTPTSRTSRRATSGRSARSTRTCAPAGSGRRARPRRHAGQPAAGRVAGRAALARAGDRAQPGRGGRQARGRRLLDAGRVGPGRGPGGRRAFTAIGRSLAGSRDPAVAQAARAAAFAGGVRDALAPLGKDGKPAYTPAAAYPQTHGRVPEAARRLRRDARRRAADPRRLDHRAGRLRHARQPGDVARPRTCKLTFDSLLAFQRDLEARGLADRVLTLVWSEFGRRAAGERLGHRPRRRRRRLPDRHARGGPDDRRVPRARASSTRTATCARPRTSAALYGALCGDWFGVDPAAILPRRPRHRRPVMLK